LHGLICLFNVATCAVAEFTVFRGALISPVAGLLDERCVILQAGH